MLIENTMFGERNKVEISIERIKFAYEVAQQRGLGALYVCFSGGKDSTVLAELCRLAKEQYGVEYELHYNVTGIDPPELIYFMRENYRCIYNGKVLESTEKNSVDLYCDMYDRSMWQLIVDKRMPPTRIVRYCCAELKERGGEGKICLTGVRWAESVNRKKNRAPLEANTRLKADKMLFNDNDDGRLGFENCTLKRKFVVNPIVDWEESDVWEFIKGRNIPYCKLYDEGQTRLGCIGCPMGGTNGMIADFERYPKFKQLYINAFNKMIANMPNKSNITWKNGEDCFNWWVFNHGGNSLIVGQIGIFDNL